MANKMLTAGYMLLFTAMLTSITAAAVTVQRDKTTLNTAKYDMAIAALLGITAITYATGTYLAIKFQPV